MRYFIFTILQVITVTLYAIDPDIATPLRWYVDTDRPAQHAIDLRRGETVIIEPTFRSYGTAVDLRDANTVIMRYRSADMTNSYYAVTGSVYNATGGVCQIRWTSACEPTNSSLTYEIAVSGSSSTVVRAYGSLKLTATLASNGSTNAQPRIYSVIDFATVDLQNVGLAPFLSSYDTSDLTDFMNAAQSGTADLDVDTLNVRGALTGSAGGLTNFPGTVVTNIVDGGTSGLTGSISRNGSTVTITFPQGSSGEGGGGGVSYLTNLLDTAISNPQVDDLLAYNGSNWYNKATGESLSTNRLTWVVDGVTIGYVNSNGITMLKGSLQLYEEELNCNVRAYDGSKQVPSVAFYASPALGWYRKSYNGDYAWAFAHNSNDVFYAHKDGITMMSTNQLSGLYLNANTAYRMNGTNGVTATYTLVDALGVTNTLKFKGGLLIP